MTNLNGKTAEEIAHEITNEARKPVDDLRDAAKEMGVSEKELAAYVKKLQYRKEYNQRPEVKAYRAVKMAERQEREKLIRERIKATGRKATLESLVETLQK